MSRAVSGPRVRRAFAPLVLAGMAAVLLAAKWPWRADPPFWDEYT